MLHASLQCTSHDSTVKPYADTCNDEIVKSVIGAHLGDAFHRGNVIAKNNNNRLTFTPISRESADKPTRGRCGQRNGLLYHAGFEDFDPESWEKVVRSPESVCLEMAPKSKKSLPTFINIKRSPETTDEKLFGITAFAINKHNMVRTNDGVGGMVGIGDHLAYDGDIHPFVMKHKEMRGNLANDLYFAGNQFAAHFAGCDVGWEEMMKLQAELWPRPLPKSAKCWHASENLGNSCHTDWDNARSFAVWLREKPDGCACRWWFLFPEYGVSIELDHGTWISWDGREQAHRSAVPSVPTDNSLLSLFTSLTANLCNVFEREQICGNSIMARQANKFGFEGVFRELDIGIPVMPRWVPEAPTFLGRKGKQRWGQSRFRWIKCKVTALNRETRLVEIRQISSPYWVHPQLSASQVYNCLVIGHC